MQGPLCATAKMANVVDLTVAEGQDTERGPYCADSIRFCLEVVSPAVVIYIGELNDEALP